MNTFTVNNKTYKAKDISFNFICDMEDRGVSFTDMESKPMKMCREYFAYCADISSEDAGREIELHAIAGGDLSTIYEAFANAVSESDFFQAISKTKEEKATPKSRKKAEQ